MKTTRLPSLCALPIAIADALEKAAPSIAFQVSREVDQFFRWDGDGPDPRDEGFSPYNVEVTARAIVNGEIVEGVAYLGSCYFRPDEPTGEIGGYLLQMLDEAAENLVGQLATLAGDEPPYLMQLADARAYLKTAMRIAYDAQMAER